MKVTLYTRPHCNYCVMAKQLLHTAGIQYTESKLDVHFTRTQLLELYPAASTYPVVVVDGYHIGGALELENFLVEQETDRRHILNEG